MKIIPANQVDSPDAKMAGSEPSHEGDPENLTNSQPVILQC